jgi:NAD(P) transhydrogenase subunit beta
MMGLTIIGYIVAGVLFIRSLAGLSRQETAARGNAFGIAGMALAIGMTLVTWWGDGLDGRGAGLGLMLAAMAGGGAIGAVQARRVEMTGMPELVAILHSFVGLAAVLVGFANHLRPPHHGSVAAEMVHSLEVWIGIAVGAVTFTGSVVAWAKLRGTVSGKPLLLPGRHVINGLIAAAVLGLAVPYGLAEEPVSLGLLLGMTAITLFLGWHLVMAIGGADMPVVVSLLNSYSGWAAAAAGFMLGNDLLVITGALVGSSGTILSIIMCRAMNRSITNVIFGGLGTASGAAPGGSTPEGEQRELQVDEVAERLCCAKEVIIVPGYGLAVARAQRSAYELTAALEARGARVRFAIHPVAGRLPGHMNVLLAEAGVPYDVVLEMDEINADFPDTDVVLVIGANDIVNPSALTEPGSPIWGMPVLECWKAKLTVVMKRGRGSGYAGIENPLFFLEGTAMLFGDAAKSLDALVRAVKDRAA